MTYINTAIMGNEWPDIKLRAVDVDVVPVIETWPQSDEGDNELITR